MYDLLIKGHLVDPASGTDGPRDIAIKDGLIVEVAPDIPADRAATVLDAGGKGRYVVPGLIDMHTHVARGANTKGLALQGCDPDDVGVRSGVTTVVDCGSTGISQIGVFPAHIQPAARTRIVCFVNAGSHAHSMTSAADLAGLDDIDIGAVTRGAAANPGLISGVKLRLVGAIADERGADMVRGAKEIARELGVPLMVHIGDPMGGRRAGSAALPEVTRYLLGALEPGDILTHLCTANVGGVSGMEKAAAAAGSNGVVLDSALGRANFGYRVAERQAQIGLHPDTISSDLTAMGQNFHSLVECMAKFLAIGYSFQDVVRMTTSAAAAALGMADRLGAVAAGREADLTILDLVPGEFSFTDSLGDTFTGRHGIVPVHTLRAGEPIAPRWGTHPWGWLPATAGAGA